MIHCAPNVTCVYTRKGKAMEITPADKAHLEFLSRMVDRLQDESFRLDKHPNVQQDLWHAREELKKFVNTLRQDGVKI